MQDNHLVTTDDTHAGDERADELPPPELPLARPGWEGYRVAEVDEFVDQVRHALRQDPPSMAPYEVADQRFTVGRLPRGYALRAVDEYLARAQELLRERHGDDAVATIEGQAEPPEHFPTGWIYVVALVLVVVIVIFGVLQL